jgi:hypothetical protein
MPVAHKGEWRPEQQRAKQQMPAQEWNYEK